MRFPKNAIDGKHRDTWGNRQHERLNETRAYTNRDRVSNQALYQSIAQFPFTFCRNTSRSATGVMSIEVA
jgi:hypothetical protein